MPKGCASSPRPQGRGNLPGVKTPAALLIVLALALGGCGDDGDESAGGSGGAYGGGREEAAGGMDGGAQEREGREPKGTRVVLADSEFGEMLFDSDEQAIYIFENDSEDESNCYGECAEAWPPVFTKGEPVAGDGVRQSLLGTTERRDGKLQVTYDGQPLYLYAHEGPGEVRCHNVNLNGGFWWVVGADGVRLP